MVQNILCKIFNDTFKTSNKILNPYTKDIEFTDFYCCDRWCVIYDIFELWRRKRKRDGLQEGKVKCLLGQTRHHIATQM